VKKITTANQKKNRIKIKSEKTEKRPKRGNGGAEDSVIAPAPQTTFHTLYQSINQYRSP
jgi:hypothetical protein